MNKLSTLLLCIVFLSCSKQTTVEMPIVQAHILHLDQIDANTVFTEFVGDVPYSIRDYPIRAEAWVEVNLYDNRLLRYYDITAQSAKVFIKNGCVYKMDISFFANPKEKDEDTKTKGKEKEGENEDEDNEAKKKDNIDTAKIKEILTQKLGEPENHPYRKQTFLWQTGGNGDYMLSLNNDSYDSGLLTIEFNTTEQEYGY